MGTSVITLHCSEQHERFKGSRFWGLCCLLCWMVERSVWPCCEAAASSLLALSAGVEQRALDTFLLGMTMSLGSIDAATGDIHVDSCPCLSLVPYHHKSRNLGTPKFSGPPTLNQGSAGEACLSQHPPGSVQDPCSVPQFPFPQRRPLAQEQRGLPW